MAFPEQPVLDMTRFVPAITPMPLPWSGQGLGNGLTADNAGIFGWTAGTSGAVYMQDWGGGPSSSTTIAIASQGAKVVAA